MQITASISLNNMNFILISFRVLADIDSVVSDQLKRCCMEILWASMRKNDEKVCCTNVHS